MITYILIGIIFMFCIEYFSNHISVREYIDRDIEIGWPERIIGISLWPICLGIFLYNFFKQFSK